MIVIDTSVAVKWVIDELRSQDALMLLDSGETLLAPDFMLVEAASGMAHGFLLTDDAVFARKCQHAGYGQNVRTLSDSVEQILSTLRLPSHSAKD